MRTTLAIDDANYKRLQAEMRKRGCSFREIVNESLRRGLDELTLPKKSEPFVVKTFPTGPRPGISFDSISSLLEEIEGPNGR